MTCTLPGSRSLILRPWAQVMAIINVTPDSFSDGGAHKDVATALVAARRAEAAGAVCLDIGGESTRPGAEAVDAQDELARVLPVVQALAGGTAAVISVDTSKGAVARAVLAAGAGMINDVSAGSDPSLLEAVAERGVPLVLMHMQGTPRTMQQAPRYDDVVDEVIALLEERMRRAQAAGVAERALLVDPGIGFGKTVAHNLALLRALPRIGAATGRPVVVGLSRKRFLSAVMGRDLPASERDVWSHHFHALIAGTCALIRTHDVPGAVDALRAAVAVQEVE
ncbi:MAG: dihydropteroate synthase [Planctomycetota bacterium]